MSGRRSLIVPAALLLAGLAAVPARGARAADEGAQPFVGDPILDSQHDLPALQRTLSLSLAIQSGRQGLAAGFHMAALIRLDIVWTDAPGSKLDAAIQRASQAHRVGFALVAAGLGMRACATAITSRSRTLADGLLGFTFPFLIGAGLDAASAVSALGAFGKLRRGRRATSGLDDAQHRSALLSEWTLAVSGILASISAVSQLLVGIAASDLAAYERRRGGESWQGVSAPALSIGPTSAALVWRF